MKRTKRKFDYSFLYGKIKQQVKSMSEYAKILGISRQALCQKMRNKGAFSQNQIITTIELFGLSAEEVQRCFFLCDES